MVRLGLAPGDPALSDAPALPALLARAVDFVARRDTLLGRSRPVGTVGLMGRAHRWIKVLDPAGRPLVTRASWDSPAAPLEVRRSGPYLLEDRHGARAAMVVTTPADDGEHPASARSRPVAGLRFDAPTDVDRSDLWIAILCALLALAILEHALFARRSVV